MNIFPMWSCAPAFAMLAVVAFCCSSSQAAERIVLENGFEMRCHHHAPTDDGHVRLYLNADKDNYIEFPQKDIVTVETVPDPPPETLRGANANNSKLSTVDLHEMLAKAGNEHNLDVDLLASLVKAESGGNARALSHAGAQGLMQLMPATAKSLGVDDSYEPNQNVRGGSTYLDALLSRYHDNLALALAAYNAGPDAVDRYHGIPPYHETRVYVARVIHEFNRRVLAREAEARRATANALQPKAGR
jgi:hypothetical protein